MLAVSGHKGVFFGGPLIEAGTLIAHTGHALGGTQAPGFVAVGFHGGVERSFLDLFTLHAAIEGEYVPLGTSLQALEPAMAGGSRLLWALPVFSTTVAVGVTFRLW